MNNQKIISPCISICKIDYNTGYCYGCARTDKEKIIDTINRKTLKKILLDNFKMEFTGEKDLTDFCNKTFKTMNIEDDEDNGIKVRDEFKYNYLLNTNDKSKVDIIQELEVLFATL